MNGAWLCLSESAGEPATGCNKMENTHGEAFPPKHYGVSDCQLVNCRTLHVWYLYHQLYKHWSLFGVFPQNFPLGLFYLIDIHVYTLWGHLVNASLHLLWCHELKALSPTVQTTMNTINTPKLKQYLYEELFFQTRYNFDHLYALNLFISGYCPITETYSYILDIFPWFTASH